MTLSGEEVGEAPRGAELTTARLALGVALASLALAVPLALRPEINIWLGTGAFAAVTLVGLPAIWGGAVARWLRPRPGFAGRVAAGAAAGVVLAAASHVFYPLGRALLPSLEPSVEALYAELAEPPGAVRALPLLAGVVLAEELAWRGPLLERLTRAFGPVPGVLAQTGLYSLPQLASGTPVLVALALGCGAFWGALRVWTGGLDAAFVCHLVWGALVFAAFPVV